MLVNLHSIDFANWKKIYWQFDFCAIDCRAQIHILVLHYNILYCRCTTKRPNYTVTTAPATAAATAAAAKFID